MSRFRRRRRQGGPGDDQDHLGETGGHDAVDGSDAGSADDETPSSAARTAGPYDLAEVDDPASGGRVDLGGMWLPGRPGLEVRVEADQATSAIVAVTLVLGEGALQVQPFAAPRSEGIWDEVRAEIRAGVTQQGGTADEVDGPLGTELRTRVPVRGADGSSGIQPARFVGVDGPRWFLRGVLTGKPAVEDGADTDLVELFRDIVVVRGDAAMAPRDPIPLALPAVAPDPTDDTDEADGSDVGRSGGEDEPTGTDDLKPFERGPEITEIR